MRRRLDCGILLAMLVIVLTGCGMEGNGAGSRGVKGVGSDDPASTDAAGDDSATEPLVLLAAASAKDAVEELAAVFERQTGSRVRISTGPSNALAAQIASGAPADLFLSANEQWAGDLEQKGLAAAVTSLLTNQLVLIVPRDNSANVQKAADLAKPNVKRVALAGENVPAGIYAEQALRALALYRPLADAKKIVRGQDVRVTLGYVARGEVDAGIVYATDARIEDAVSVVDRFDPKTHGRIDYLLLLVNRERHNAIAKALYEFLQSAEAARVFEKFGFDHIAEK